MEWSGTMTLRQLEVLVAVADAGSMSRAGASLGVSQPLVTHQIQILEEELNCRLVSRSSRTTVLTPAGMIVVATARRILYEVDSIPNAIADHAKHLRGTVVLGASPLSPISVHFFPPLYKDFHQSYPDIEVEVMECASSQLGEQVRKGIVDLAIMPLPVFSTHLTFETLWVEELVVIADTGDSLPPDPVRLLNLKDRHFVAMKPDFGLAHTVSALAQAEGFVPRVAQQVSSISALIGFVAAGIGLAIVPWESVRLEVLAGYLAARPLVPAAYRRFALVLRQDSPLSAAAEALANAIRTRSHVHAANPWPAAHTSTPTH